MAVNEPTDVERGRPSDAVRRWGVTAWAVVGIFLATIAVLVTYRIASGTVVPVVLALVLAVMTMPLTDWLDRFLPRGLAVALVMLLCAALVLGLTVVFVRGVSEQIPAIEKAVQDGITQLLDALGIDPSSQVGSAASDAGATATSVLTGLEGLTGFLVSSVESVISMFFGVFISAMVLFLVLLNPKESQGWVARVLPWPAAQSERLFSTSGQVIFDYYKGCTILACVNAIPIWLVALALDIEAAGAILVVLFVSSYIPYVGAWIGGAFAVLLALGTGGMSDGWIMLAAVLIVNLGLQSIIQPFAFGATMKVSPLGVFLFTLLGGAVAGVLGAMMAAPVMALATRFATDVRLPADPAPADPDG